MLHSIRQNPFDKQEFAFQPRAILSISFNARRMKHLVSTSPQEFPNG